MIGAFIFHRKRKTRMAHKQGSRNEEMRNLSGNGSSPSNTREEEYSRTSISSPPLPSSARQNPQFHNLPLTSSTSSITKNNNNNNNNNNTNTNRNKNNSSFPSLGPASNEKGEIDYQELKIVRKLGAGGKYR